MAANSKDPGTGESGEEMADGQQERRAEQWRLIIIEAIRLAVELFRFL